MEYSELKILLDKYFLGETTPDEEKTLKKVLQDETLPEPLKLLRTFFDTTSIPKEIQLNDDFDKKIVGFTTENSHQLKPAIRLFSFLRAASIIILIVTGGFLMYNYLPNKFNNKETAINNMVSIDDTYQDPVLARQELEKALELLSSKMNKGNELAARKTSRLQVISNVLKTTD